MGLFDNVDNSATTQAERDVVRGQRREPIPSSIQNLIIKYVYGQKSTGGAMGIHALLEVADGDHKGREIRVTEYVTSGDAKGNKTYYERKSDKGTEQFKLPGFTAMDSLAKLAAGKGILSCASEKKTIKLYDFDKKAEVPTEVDMLVELVGKGVCGCVLSQIEDKTAKNSQTGVYEPTGKTYTINVVDKYLNASDRKTVSERDNDLAPDFKDKWAEKWNGQINDQSSEVKNSGLKGAPAASGENAEKSSLFV